MIQVLSGLGGVGKTQIAIEYIYRYANQYKLIWWIDASTKDTLEIEYCKLGMKLGYEIDINMLNRQEKIDFTISWLNNNDSWLLVIDDAKDMKEIYSYLPRGMNGDIIILSRNNQWEQIATNIPVESFDKKEGVQFLLERTSSQDDGAEELVKQLGGLPLALEQAVTYIRGKQIAIKDYLQLFLKYRVELFKQGQLPLGYDKTVATTWKISFQNIHDKYIGGEEILYILSYMHFSEIPLELFLEAEQELPACVYELISEELIFNEFIEELLKYSLISKVGNKISLHCLVQTVIRENIPDDDKQYWINICVKILNKIFYINDNNDKGKNNLHIHALSVIEHLKIIDINDKDTINIINNVCMYFNETAQYEQAIILLEKIVNQTCEHNSKDMIESITMMGYFYARLGKIEEGIAWYLKALYIIEKSLSSYNDIKINIFTSLSALYDFQNNFQQSQRYNKKAIELCEQNSNYDLDMMFTTKINHVGYFYSIGEYQKAKEYIEEIIGQYINKEINKEISNESYFSMLSLHAQILQSIGEYNEALVIEDKALDFVKSRYKGQHPYIARVLNDYGIILMSLNRLDEAEEKIKEALEISKKVYKDNHTDIATTLMNLGRVHERKNELDIALKYLNQAMKIYLIIYDEKHSQISDCLNNIGMVYIGKEDFLEAIKYFKKALKMDISIYGKEHGDVATSLINMGRAFSLLRKDKVSEKLVEKAIEIDMKYGESNKLNIMRDYEHLCQIYIISGDLDRALMKKLEQIEIYRKITKIKSKELGKAYLDCARIYRELRKAKRALEYYEKAYVIFKKHEDSSFNDILHCLYTILEMYIVNKFNLRELEKYVKDTVYYFQLYKDNLDNDIAMGIGGVLGYYFDMVQEYKKALEFEKLALNYAKKYYPEGHAEIRSIAANIRVIMAKIN